jgi:hypothetical protein
MIIFESILTTFKSSSIFGSSWGSSVNWLTPKTKPPSGNLVCPNSWNALYSFSFCYDSSNVVKLSIFTKPIQFQTFKTTFFSFNTFYCYRALHLRCRGELKWSEQTSVLSTSIGNATPEQMLWRNSALKKSKLVLNS